MIPLHQGSGTTAYQWRHSETMVAVRNLPKDVGVVSNDSYAIWVWADRPAYDLWNNFRSPFLDQNTSYGTDPSDPAQVAFHEKKAVLVIFTNEFSQQMASNFGDRGTARLDTIFSGLIVSEKLADGVIYYFPK
jgi:hypothetical protein